MAKTVQDVVDALSAEKRDLFDLVVGASVEGEQLEADDAIAKTYESFSVDEKNVLDFVVGGLLIKDSSATHSDDLVENFLAHHGVKGMKWGVRKREDSGANVPLRKVVAKTPEGAGLRAMSRAKVKQGTGDIGNAHVAALKSKGHRAANAFLGDKTYWKRAAIIAGIGIAGVVAATTVPGLMPMAALGWVGTHIGAAGSATAALHLQGATAATVQATVGKSVMTSLGLAATKAGVTGASVANKVSNTVRAVRGNARVEESFNKMGKHLWDSQRSGSKEVQKILARNGSISPRKLRLSGADKKVLSEVGPVHENVNAMGKSLGVKHSVLTEDGQYLSHADTGNTDAVIVALPRALDPVRLVGDEDKHATLLYFGPTASLPADAKENLLATLAQASKMFMPFSEGTIGTERLGSDVPPALVTRLTQRKLGLLRQAIQVNPLVGDYLKNADQHPEYKPHVTFGYPDWGGEKKLVDLAAPLYEVCFDRLALWWNDERFEIPLGPDTRMEPMDSVKMAETVENFLAHHGIKGMKWGIRRSQKALDSQAGRKPDTDNSGNDRSAKKAMDKMKTGSVVPMQQSDGTTKLLIKKKDGSWKETFVSADAEKFIASRNKEGHELSTRDLKETLARARQVEEYNMFFSENPNKELQAKVDAMRLQSEYARYKQELRPPTTLEKFSAKADQAYNAYNKLDKISGGLMSKKIHSSLAGAFAEAAKPATDAVKDANKSAKAKKAPKQPKPPKGPTFRGKTAGMPTPPTATFKPNPAFRPTMRVNPDGSATPVYNITDLGKGYTPPANNPNIPEHRPAIEAKKD